MCKAIFLWREKVMTINITMQPSFGNSAHLEGDKHSIGQHQFTQTQLILLIAYLIIAIVWLFNSLTFLTQVDIFPRKKNSSTDILKSCLVECNLTSEAQEYNSDKDKGDTEQQEDLSPKNEVLNLHTNNVSEDFKERKSLDIHDSECNNKTVSSHLTAVKHKRTQEAAVVVTSSKFISSLVMFGIIMIYFYLCDYAKIFPQGERVYSRDTFLFLVFIFFLVGCAFSIKPNPDIILNRDQTEEWKGWMQVMFVWYHYFMAKEWYNWIRVYIACYVWMTGFGNFSFFWIRNDFSAWRLLKMLFRLNFLVIFVALTTANEYMLYYICAMHTYWFISVYLFMRCFHSWNCNPVLMTIKFIAYAVFNAIIFDIPGMSYIVFRPFSSILGFNDNSTNILHEWSFRAGLDHWACFVGMLCAYNYPHFEAFMKYIDSKSVQKKEDLTKTTLRVAIIIGCLLLMTWWYTTFMWKDKIAYNITHPYSSMIPIMVFVVARNIHPVLRAYHIQMFANLGKMTLETYLSQLHIYLLSNARMLLVFLPSYPLLNFSLATVIYLYVSHTLFTITNDCSNFLLPNDQNKLLINLFFMVALFSVSVMIAYGLSVL
uniref:Cas1p 10 TM acyl transferase domain-containing protein n=1 Tax=Arion vulgaris TaxID=1028688 RepID=A0A0B7AH19_9EUPU